MENHLSLLNATHSNTPTPDLPSSPTSAPTCPGWPSLPQNIVIPTLYVIICTLGIVGNTLAVCVLARSGRSRRTVANTFMLNLCLCDLLFLLSLPLWAVYYSQRYHWSFGWFACKLCGGLLSLNLYASIFFITCMSVDRYLAIVRPLRAQSTREPRRAQLACGLVWVLAFASSAPTLVLRDTSHVKELKVEACVILYPHHGWFLTLAWMKMLLGFLLPMAVITSCYCAIARHLMRGDRGLGAKCGANGKAQQLPDNLTKADSSPRLPATSLGQKPPGNCDRQPSTPCSVRPLEGRGLERVLWTVAAVVLAFFLCWFPFHLLTLLDVLQKLGVVQGCWGHWSLSTLLPLSLALGFSNSAINPVLYCFLGNHFRGLLGGMCESLCVCGRAHGEGRMQKRGSFRTRLSSLSRKQSETSGLA